MRIEPEQALALAPVNAAGAPASALLLIPVLVQARRCHVQKICPRACDRCAGATPRPFAMTRISPAICSDLLATARTGCPVPVPDLLGGSSDPGVATPT